MVNRHADRLCDTGFSALSIQHLASALSTNESLIELDLGHNKVCDAGVKHLSEALKDQDWKIQKLRLDDTRLSDSCINDLVSALGTNRSVTELNLESNSFTDQSIPKLQKLIINCSSLDRIELWKNRFSSTGENRLKSLQGIRRGLSVVLTSC
ncbi:NACHT, LRR and PYD domains-containing protein 12-like [Scyliorhinus canicula]|uniref:NACHT, LRR and PYD domains-containing protein 12-like n=1 Tax=Scyliorhinus canicula TaxID=7830 RepID=UPI0018F56AFC|nr:NACHT, LRR and PYD domains-containing protein 12-like [Scyliorhinus canicula]